MRHKTLSHDCLSSSCCYCADQICERPLGSRSRTDDHIIRNQLEVSTGQLLLSTVLIEQACELLLHAFNMRQHMFLAMIPDSMSVLLIMLQLSADAC